MKAINKNKKGQGNEILVNLEQRLLKLCLFTLVINWINKLQEIVDGSEKSSTHFIKGNYNKIFLYTVPTKIPTIGKRLNFRKR